MIDQPSLPFSNPTTSREAADSMREKAPRLRQQVLLRIDFWTRMKWGGATCDEIERELSLSHQTASARIRELAQLGSVQDSGERRKTSSGRKAIVWATRKEA